jgi:hypothetical protein
MSAEKDECNREWVQWKMESMKERPKAKRAPKIPVQPSNNWTRQRG